jgi:hypothetical protein
VAQARAEVQRLNKNKGGQAHGGLGDTQGLAAGTLWGTPHWLVS